MTKHRALRGAAGAFCILAGLAACGSAPPVASAPALAPSRTVAEANARLAAVERERKAIEARFAERESVCYDKFFVNNCLDEAKERRRTALAAQRAIEVEASHYLRQEKVNERDREMAEAEARYKAEEEELARQPASLPRAVTDVPVPRPSQPASRIARHNAKVQQAEAHDKAEAAKRASNVEEYKQREAESKERQRVVAKRKADKAAKEAKKQGAAGQQPAPATPATPATPPAQ
jgi:colicin import membrane protein